MISLSLLLQAVHVAAPDLSANAGAQWSQAFSAALPRYGITTPRQAAGFLGNGSEESAGFAELVEDLSYSALGAHNTWPTRFPTVAAAQPYAHQPEKLANRVYGGRMGNGPESSGDGWLFRGRGFLQTTGRDSYARAARDLGKPLDDDFAAWLGTIEGAVEIACWDFSDMGCGPIADAWNLEALTQRINGGLTGYAARVVDCNRILAVLQGAAPPATQASPPPESDADKLMDAELAQLPSTEGTT